MSICLKDVCKVCRDGQEKEILHKISLKIEDGEMVAIKGKSGAGKSTLLHLIGCMDQITSGTYELDGEMNIEKKKQSYLARLRNEKFGFIMQDFGLIQDETVLSNVALPLMFGKAPLGKINDMAREQLRKIEIEHLADRLVEGLSGGEKQRVAIARALVNHPKYILADEPTGALDTANAEMVVNILRELNRKEKKTIIMITHDDVVAQSCGRVMNIQDGVLC